jgi:hypothetical protein
MAVWLHTIDLGDIFHDHSLAFEKKRDLIVERLRASDWVKQAHPNSLVADTVDELAETFDEEEFDEVWNDLYDRADVDRVWIETLTCRP